MSDNLEINEIRVISLDFLHLNLTCKCYVKSSGILISHK